MENHLRHLMNELSGAIGRAKRAEEREDLARLHGTVESRLSGPEDNEHEGLVEALEEAEIRFEADHPTLAEALRRAIQALSAAGI